MNYKILISRENGYIGRNFCKYLDKKKVIYSFYKQNKKKNYSSFTHFFHLDFLIKKEKKSKTVNKNLNEIKKIISLCLNNKIKLVFPSTASFLYLNNKRISNEIFQTNDYTRSKKICENEILKAHNKKNLEYIIFRIFNVYGGDFHNRVVVTEFIKKMSISKFVSVKYPFNKRDFIFINDLFDLLLKSIKSKKNGTFEVGTGKSTSIFNLANKINKVFKFKCSFSLTKPYKSFNNSYSKSKPMNTFRTFSWKPSKNLDQGLLYIKNNFKFYS
jgi:nucleoside-diphosphate-sugar epimerase